MRILCLALTLVSLLAPLTIAQEAKSAANAGPSLGSYMVTLVEFRMKSNEPSMTSARLAEEFESYVAQGGVSVVETMRVSVLELHKTSVMFGRTVALVTGVTQTQAGKTRNYTQRSLGTSVKMTVESVEDKALLSLEYQASRIAGAAEEDVTPDIETVEIETSLLLKLGKRVVVAGTTASDSTFLMVTLTKDEGAR